MRGVEAAGKFLQGGCITVRRKVFLVAHHLMRQCFFYKAVACVIKAVSLVKGHPAFALSVVFRGGVRVFDVEHNLTVLRQFYDLRQYGGGGNPWGELRGLRVI